MEIPQHTINMGLTARFLQVCLQNPESKCKQTCSRTWDGLSFGDWWNDCSRPQALPALALQALGGGAHGVWVQLCPPGRPGGLGKEALVWPSPVQKLPSQGLVGTLVLHMGLKSIAYISF